MNVIFDQLTILGVYRLGLFETTGIKEAGYCG